MGRLARRLGSMWHDRSTAGVSRLMALGGAGSVLAGVILSWFLMALFPAGQAIPPKLTAAFVVSAACAASAFLAAFMPWRWLSAAILGAAFAWSFLMHFGWYFLLFVSSFPPFALIGLGEVLYAAAALTMSAAAYWGPPRRRARL